MEIEATARKIIIHHQKDKGSQVEKLRKANTKCIDSQTKITSQIPERKRPLEATASLQQLHNQCRESTAPAQRTDLLAGTRDVKSPEEWPWAHWKQPMVFGSCQNSSTPASPVEGNKKLPFPKQPALIVPVFHLDTDHTSSAKQRPTEHQRTTSPRYYLVVASS